MDNTLQTFDNSTSTSGLQSIGEQLMFPHITVEIYESFGLVTNTIVMPVLCVISIIGNILGLGLLLKLKRDNNVSIYTYLCALTLSDILYLVVGFVRRIPYLLKFYDEHIANLIDGKTIVTFVVLDNIFIHTSNAIIVVISIERVIALVRPLTVKETCFSKHPFKIIMLCFALNIISATPLAIMLEATDFVNENNITEYYLRANNSYAMRIVLIEQTVVDFLVPVVILLCTNTGIAIAYSRMIKIRQTTLNMDDGNTSSQQKKVTLTVFCITTLFLVLSIPDMIFKSVAFIDNEYSWEGKYKHVFWFFLEITNLMTYINAGNDFVIYVLVSDRCRKLFKQMYCSCCIQHSNSGMSNKPFSSIYSTSDGTLNSRIDFEISR